MHSEHGLRIIFFVIIVRIDLFSLDIEGAEYGVLKTVPWDKVNIDALLVEVTFSYKWYKNFRNMLRNVNT
jgi:hypothetical protein